MFNINYRKNYFHKISSKYNKNHIKYKLAGFYEELFSLSSF